VAGLRYAFVFTASVAFGCREDAGESSADAGVADSQASQYSFSPSFEARECTSDDDCVILTALHECSSCCGEASVRRGAAEAAHAATLEACRQPGAPPSRRCAMACGDSRAACFEQVCVKVPVEER
jgi:hypothetical protein